MSTPEKCANQIIDDVRWQWSTATWTGSPEGEHNSAHQYGVPPRGNANFAWVQHFIHHLAPHGMAGFVLPNGSMSSNQSGEDDIRRALIEAVFVDCMVALSGQLSSNWFPARRFVPTETYE
jgi:type I restriction-modification system DNA methylase subunit